MMSTKTKPRRVQLAVPASSEKLIAKSAGTAADHVFLDLEDAVAPNAKDAARELVIAGLNTHDWGRKVRCVRINELASEHCYRDIVDIVRNAGRNLDTVMVPKVRSAADIHFVDTLLGQVEKAARLERKIGIEVLIEEVEAVMNVMSISRASDRIESLIFGIGDFSASMGIDIDRAHRGEFPGDVWHVPRFQMVMAARAAGVDAIDGPTLDVKDTSAYAADARRGAIMGFSGKWAIHPLQIAPALEVFTPDAAAVARSRRLLAAYAQAEAEGTGSITFEGEMVDAAVARNHRLLAERATAMGA